jgi:DNA-binding MarR family transcriptional regulator
MRLATFRRTLRRFLRFSETAAGQAGLTGRQYQALLAIRANPAGGMTIRDLAQELNIKHNSAVELADRLGSRELIWRKRSSSDRRKVEVRLTQGGIKILRGLTSVHRHELRRVGPIIRDALAEFSHPDSARPRKPESRNRKSPH